MFVTIAIWAVISFSLGWVITCTPLATAAVCGMPIFVTPFVLFSLQYNYFPARESSWSIFDLEIWRKDVKYRQMTVWGIPVWWREPIETRNLILPSLTVAQVVTIFWKTLPVLLIPVAKATKRISSRKS